MTDQITYSFFGHSHLSALLRAGQRHARSPAAEAVKLVFSRLNHKMVHPNFEVVEGERAIHKDLQRKLRFILRRDAPAAVFLPLMGNEYNSIAMLRHPQPFDFHLEGSGLETSADATIIPFDVIKAEVVSLAERNTLMFLEYFTDQYKGPIYLVPPPPPIADEAHIWSYPGAFSDRLKEYVSRPGRLRGDLTKRCGWDLCQSFMACIGVRLPKTDCGNCVL